MRDGRTWVWGACLGARTQGSACRTQTEAYGQVCVRVQAHCCDTEPPEYRALNRRGSHSSGASSRPPAVASWPCSGPAPLASQAGRLCLLTSSSGSLSPAPAPGHCFFFKDFFVGDHFIFRSLLDLLQWCLCFCFFGHEACGVIVPQPGIEPEPPPPSGAQSLNHWMAREVSFRFPPLLLENHSWAFPSQTRVGEDPGGSHSITPLPSLRLPRKLVWKACTSRCSLFLRG